MWQPDGHYVKTFSFTCMYPRRRSPSFFLRRRHSVDITECRRREIPRWERRLGYINDVCRSSRRVVHAMNRSDEPPRRSTADTLNIGKSDGTGVILA